MLSPRLRSVFGSALPLIVVLGVATSATTTSAQAASSEQQELVDKASLAVQDLFRGTKPTSRAQRYLAKARAVMVCPSIFRVSIGIGGSGGGCVLLSRAAQGSWSDPAFYTLSSGSLGIQLGMDDSEMMLFVMSDRGLQALLDSQFKFNAGASASFATMGTGVEDSTAGVSNTDIVAIQKSKGLFAGAALGGSKLTVNSGANRSYYGQTVGPVEIVVTMKVNNSGADPLRRILSGVAQTQPTASQVATPSSAAMSPQNNGQTIGSTTDSGAMNISPYPNNYDSNRAYSTQVQQTPINSPR